MFVQINVIHINADFFLFLSFFFFFTSPPVGSMKYLLFLAGLLLHVKAI